MLILAIHAGPHDSCAALFRGYSLIAAVQQERLTRRKGDGGIPQAAVSEVLAIAGVEPAEVAVLVVTRAHFPVRYFIHIGAYKRVEDWINRTAGKERRKDVAVEMSRSGAATANEIFDSRRLLALFGLRPEVEVFFCNHHLAHALSALFCSTFDEALIYTADGCGDNVHYSHRILDRNGLTCHFGDDRWLRQPRRVDSLGLAYGYTTEALGYHEEPIVNSPDDCLRALQGDRIDFVATGGGVYRLARPESERRGAAEAVESPR